VGQFVFGVSAGGDIVCDSLWTDNAVTCPPGAVLVGISALGAGVCTVPLLETTVVTVFSTGAQTLATCPVGYRLTGGGHSAVSTTATAWRSMPSGNAWLVSVTAGSFGSDDFTVYAVCARVTV
jgi:hypothetical protein